MRWISKRVSSSEIEQMICSERINIMDVHRVFISESSRVIAILGQKPIESMGERIMSEHVDFLERTLRLRQIFKLSANISVEVMRKFGNDKFYSANKLNDDDLGLN